MASQHQQQIVAEETEDQDQEEEEEECEDDYKERRGEELSLLGHAHSLEASPAPSSRLHHWSPGARRYLDSTPVTQYNVTACLHSGCLHSKVCPRLSEASNQ